MTYTDVSPLQDVFVGGIFYLTFQLKFALYTPWLACIMKYNSHPSDVKRKVSGEYIFFCMGFMSIACH
jgi:hypothetical protein